MEGVRSTVHRTTSSGAVALSHLDGSGTEEAVMSMIHRVQELALGFPEGRLELQMVGETFHKQLVEIDLAMACVGELNTTVRGNMRCPILYGCGVNVKTGELFPANFPDKGPDQALRNVYDCSLGLLRIGPFNYDPLRGVDLWLEQSDDFILQQLSTSPEVEPPHFVDHHPFPAVTVFRDNRPHYYRRDENIGTWTPVIY
uniref:Protein N-terminal asparagine amidohydrolase n=1 Tax=Timema monikensis TaxID=170555 RepID=A0A7R9E6L4_9NEOP|nr:unnamed protein product [Timema monikensis]